MRSESEIRERLERVEESLENSSGHDQSHLIGVRNALEWALESGTSGLGSSTTNSQYGSVSQRW